MTLETPAVPVLGAAPPWCVPFDVALGSESKAVVRLVTDDPEVRDVLASRYGAWAGDGEVAGLPATSFAVVLRRRQAAGPRRLPYLERDGRVLMRSERASDVLAYLDVSLGELDGRKDSSGWPIVSHDAVVDGRHAVLVPRGARRRWDGWPSALERGLDWVPAGLVGLAWTEQTGPTVRLRTGLSGDLGGGACRLLGVGWAWTDDLGDRRRAAEVARWVRCVHASGVRLDQAGLQVLERITRQVVSTVVWKPDDLADLVSPLLG